MRQRRCMFSLQRMIRNKCVRVHRKRGHMTISWLSNKGYVISDKSFISVPHPTIPAFQEENKLGSILKCFSMVGLKGKCMLFFFFMFQGGVSNVGITLGFSKCQWLFLPSDISLTNISHSLWCEDTTSFLNSVFRWLLCLACIRIVGSRCHITVRLKYTLYTVDYFLTTD